MAEWRLAASVLSADVSRLGELVGKLAATGVVDRIQVDVMDGMFVPNISFGPLIFEALKRSCRLPLEGHLMIAAPDRYYARFREAGAASLIVHQEACPHLYRDLQAVRALGARVGVAINPGTPTALLHDVLPLIDTVLVMSVNPGFGGQAFLPVALDKIRELRASLAQRGLSAEIEVDGGVNRDTVRQLLDAGADVLVVGSALFPPDDNIAGAVKSLVAAAGSPPTITEW